MAQVDFDSLLQIENVSGDKAEFIKSIYQQESSSGGNTKTSNAGAVGGMQIIPSTFKGVADEGWDINNPEHSARAGIRYASYMYDRANGDVALAGAGYYGGEGGMDDARKGVARRDKRNPNAPDTLEYGRQVAARMKGGGGGKGGFKFVGYTDADGNEIGAPEGEEPQTNNRFIKRAKDDGFKFVGYEPVYPDAPDPQETVEEAPPPERTVGNFTQDAFWSLVDGAVAVPEAVVGLLDLVTGGRVGKAIEDYTPIQFKQAHEAVQWLKSDVAKQNIAEFQAAEGFIGKAKAVAKSPTLATDAILQSLPSIGTGGVFARAMIKVLPKLAGYGGGIAASAGGEGLVIAGQGAEGIRQETEDGLLSAKQASLAAGSGVAGVAITAAAGVIARKLGIRDIDTTLASGGDKAAEQAIARELANKVNKNFVRRGIEGAITEGVLEEMPQSAVETMLTNIALDKPVMEGVDEAMVLGLAAGAGVGTAFSVLSGDVEPTANPDAPPSDTETDASDDINLDAMADDEAAQPTGVDDDGTDEQGTATTMDAGSGGEGDSDGNGSPIDSNNQGNEPDRATVSVPEVPSEGSTRTEPIQQQEADIERYDRSQNSLESEGFDTLEDAKQYISQQKRNGASISALPYQREDGRFDVAIKGTPQYKEAQKQGVTTKTGNGTTTQTVSTNNEPETTATKSDNPVANAKVGDVITLPNGLKFRKTENGVERISDDGVIANNEVDNKAHEAATSPLNDLPEPTQPQKKAGNSKLGHPKISGLEISIENPDGSTREGTDPNGKAWKNTMNGHYGYFKGVVARAPDKEHVDVNVKPNTPEDYNGNVYVINQNDPQTGEFDEPKVYVGYGSMQEAREAYLSNYADDWKGLDSIVSMPMESLKARLNDKNGFLHPIGAKPKSKVVEEVKKSKEKSAKNGTSEQSDSKKSKVVEEVKAAKAKSNAPEHQNIGVDDRELSEIVGEFNEAQAEMYEGDELITHIFDAPDKKDIVRLQDKVKVYNKDKGWMTVEEAKAEIEKWKDHATKQGKENRRENNQKIVLSLFDLTGKWAEPWVEAGYQVYTFDIQDMNMIENSEGEEINTGDVNNFSVEFFSDIFGSFDGLDIHAILAACPCTDFAVSGARHFAAKDADGRTIASVELVHQALRTIEYFKPAIWAIENPVGRIEKLGGLPPWRLSFDPNHIGDPYTKKTLLWGRFNADLPIAPVEPTEGSKMHTKYGGSSLATKNARSATPEGFAYSFFMANNAVDHPVMTIANKFDRLDRDLIEQAVNAGISEDEITHAVEDFYYQDLDDEGANNALRELINPEPDSVPEESSNDQATVKETDPKQFANNTVFTQDKVDAARQRLTTKLKNINSGIDPELLVDGMTIAGAYIESGIRSFAAYSKAMIDDFGDDIKPYLLSFYEAARAYPGIEKEGMTSVEKAAAEYQEQLTSKVKDSVKEIVGNGVEITPKKRPKPKGTSKLTEDWGVDHIDGWTESKTGANEETDFGLRGGVKDEFLKESAKYLKETAKLLEAEGFEPYTDKRGRVEKSVSTNEGGQAVSGEVTLTMRKGAIGIYAQVGVSSMRGMFDDHPQGVIILSRVHNKADNDKYAGDNTWLKSSLSTTELASSLVERAKKLEGVQDARVIESEQVPERSSKNDNVTKQSRGGNSEPLAVGVGRQGKRANPNQSVSGDLFESSGSGTPSVSGNDRQQSPITDGKTSTTGDKSSTADVDYTASSEETTEGTAAKKFRDNVNAIKILKTLDSENRKATPEERDQLAKYAGFGALTGVFDPSKKQFEKQYNELKSLLTEEEYASARASILNAYYTSKAIVGGMYDGLQKLGFAGGRVLEPAVGSGNFFANMPSSVRSKSELHGVELDLITSKLAKALYPNAKISVNTGFEKFHAPQGYFDAVISNPPFGSEVLVDAERAKYSGFNIHNFFIAKSIDKLREGGVAAIVVTHNFMDARKDTARKWIAERANLIGAVRLPNNAFGSTGTDVVTDILYFQKTSNPDTKADWVTSKDSTVTDEKSGQEVTEPMNNYFVENPDHILGKVTAKSGKFGLQVTVEADDKLNLDKAIKEFNNKLPGNIYVEPESRIIELDSADNTVPDGVKVGTLYVNETGEIRQRLPDMLGEKRSMPIEVPSEKARERIIGMMDLRDTLRKQMRLERSADSSKAEIEENRKQLNDKYDRFVKGFGYLNNQTNRRLFIDDTESALLQALEFDYDAGVSAARAKSSDLEERPETATKAPILKNRVLFPPSSKVSVSTAKDGLLASLNDKGGVDLDYIAEVYKKSQEEIIAELSGVIYENPLGGYEIADQYLSGDVKTKLVEAKHAAKTNPAFNSNVEALEKVIPKDKLPSEIHASMGVNWVPAEYYREFLEEITGIPKQSSELRYLKEAGMWLFGGQKSSTDTAKMISEFGTSKINAMELFELTMNGKSPNVTMRVPDGKGSYRLETDMEATEAARAKQNAIKEKWESWVFSDPTRADVLAEIYNEKHNRVVNRQYDGSHLKLHGSNPAITLRQSQLDVIWRAIQDRRVLLDHVVGAGKTFAMTGIVMEMKRLGIVRKPILVVPNHLTLQWRSEFTALYPASNILAATPEDFAKGKREKMFSKMVTGDFDAIIIGHSSLTKVGLPAEVEERLYQEQINEIAAAVEQVKSERGDRNIIRDMEKIIANLEAKIAKLQEKAGKRDDVVSFDEIGIDGLFVDEMHEFKNLFFTTQMQRTSGLGNPAGSGKAFDMFMKIKWMTETFGEKSPLITATGTPVSNSLAEMFTMQRYMNYNEMKREGLHLFDTWAKQYGDIENVYEVAPSGVGYRQSTRFSKFMNLPSLMGNYKSFADIITLDDLKQQQAARGEIFPVPKIKTGKPINVVAKRSDLQTNFFGVPQLERDEQGNIKFQLDPSTAEIIEADNNKFLLKHSNGIAQFETREEAELELVTLALTPVTSLDPDSLLGKFDRLKELTRKTNGKVNALSLTGLANKAGLDFRLIDPNAKDFEGSKINQAVNNMVDLWKRTTKVKGTQIIFCDLSVPLSAKASMATQERRAYVRDEKGEITHKKATVYSSSNNEGFPFYLVSTGKGESKAVEIYEGASGVKIETPTLADRTQAKAFIDEYVKDEANQDFIFSLREEQLLDDGAISEYRDAKELEVADDGSNEFTMQDLESITSVSGFSVYDDIKAKLIDKGVPENQIAFIHDYNTPKKKEALFKSVKRGDVRFLMGSTPKLGAGTNVQDLLVGMHHIDAPWRPSDLEQREGRIIRQGNTLAYTKDKDGKYVPIEGFEVEIYRYATEQTYDTRRWQLLEHKASGIEQLRKYSGELQIEDIATEAANSADMKASASGNPLILEETQLRTEIKRLKSLQKAHEDSIYRMNRKINTNTERINTRIPNQIAELKALIEKTKKHPIPSNKEQIASIGIDGFKTTNKTQAEEALKKTASKVAYSYDLGSSKTINYRGMDVVIKRIGFGNIKVDDANGTELFFYADAEKFSPSGFITRLNNMIEAYPDRVKSLEQEIVTLEAENKSLKPRLTMPFEEAGELKAAQEKHKDVQRRLMKSTQLDSVPKDQVNEFKSMLNDRKESIKQLGYTQALKEYDIDDKPLLSASESSFGMPVADVQAIVDELVKEHKAIKNVVVVENTDALPIDKKIKSEIAKQKRDMDEATQAFYKDATVGNYKRMMSVKVNDVEGVYYNGKVYLNAGNLPDAERVKQVFAHEAIGHLSVEEMLDEVDPTLMPKMLSQVKLLDKTGNKYIRTLAARVDETQPGLDVDTRAKEIIAQIAENGHHDQEMGKTARSIWQKIMDGIKAFAKLVFDIDLTDRDVRDIVAMAARYSKGENVTSMVRTGQRLFARQNRTPSKDAGDTFVTAALEFLAREPEFFQNPITESTKLEDVVSEIDEGYRVQELGASMTKEKNADRAWEITVPNSAFRAGTLLEKGNEVWVDVSHLLSGQDRGSTIYDIAAAYAHNNGKVFIGDPIGLSRKAFYRRNENMLSSALKYGTTRHLKPHLAQEIPSEYFTGTEKAFGQSVRPLNWVDGDDVNNIKELVYNSWHSLVNNIPEFKNVVYNPTNEQFETINGEPFTDDDFAKTLSNHYDGTGAEGGRGTSNDSASNTTKRTTRASDPYSIGISTAKRATLFNTFLREQSREGRQRVLGEISAKLSGNGLSPALKGVMYSRSNQTVTTSPSNEPAPKAMGELLNIFDRNQIVTLYEKHLPELRAYKNNSDAIVADRNTMMAESDVLLREMQALPKAQRDKLASIAHEATIEGFDPSKAGDSDKMQTMKKAFSSFQKMEQRELPFSEIQTNYYNKLKKTLPKKIAKEQQLRKDYDSLSAESKAIFNKLKQAYIDNAKRVFDELEKRIERMDIDQGQKAGVIQQLRAEFDKLKSSIYFPLSRFGDYVVIGTKEVDGENVRSVEYYESEGKAKAAAALMRADGYKNVKQTKRKEFTNEFNNNKTVSSIVGKIKELRDLANEAKEFDKDNVNSSLRADKNNLFDPNLDLLLDEVNQVIIQMLPDQSFRRHFMHRKNVPGYSQDFVRAYADSMWKSANHITNLRYGDRQTAVIEAMQRRIDETEEGDTQALQDVVNHIIKREEVIRRPTSRVTAFVGQMGFLSALASVSNFFVNLTQTPILTYPWLGARYGYGTASIRLTAALSKQVASLQSAGSMTEFKDRLDMRKNLKGDELEIFNTLHKIGKLDLTQAYDLIDAANKDTPVNRNKPWQVFMRVAALPQHASEVMNRQITALATIRLEMAKSNDADKALHAAIEAIDQTHYDYESSNRPVIMHGNVPRVVTMFKQYAQKTAFLWGHTVKLAVAGDSKEVKRVARKQVAGMLAMQAVFSGVLGLPIFAEAAVVGAGVAGFKVAGKKGAYVGTLAALIAVIAKAMDDDEDEFDTEVRNFMADNLGKTWGEVVSRGAIRLTGADVSARLSASELLIRRPDKELRGDDAALEWMQAILGYAVGKSVEMYNGLDMIQSGHVERGLERIVPVKAIKDSMVAMRYQQEGITNFNGDSLLDREPTNLEKIYKLMGFTPREVAEAYERNSAIKGSETILNQQRSRLIRSYVDARRNKEGAEVINEIKADIVEFNKEHPTHRILTANLVRSVIARNRASRETEGGLRVSRKHQELREKGRFANVE